MSFPNNPIVFVLLLLSMSCLRNKEVPPPETALHPGTYPLIEVSEFLAKKSLEGYAIIDVRPPEDYAQGHLPNAINIWRTEIEDSSYPYKGILLPKSQMEQLFSNKGIKAADTLILYDDNGSCDAARLWWILDHYGHRSVRILNGGLRHYVLQQQPLYSDFPKQQKTHFRLGEARGEHYITTQQLHKALAKNRPFRLIDCRSVDEYSGKRRKAGAKKAGRIPNSISWDWTHAMDQSDNQRFLPLHELDQLYGKVAPDKETPIVVYCHSGVRSSHTTFVLTQLLGYKHVKNYDGSWIAWSYYDTLPYEKDEKTIIFE